MKYPRHLWSSSPDSQGRGDALPDVVPAPDALTQLGGGDRPLRKESVDFPGWLRCLE